MKRFVKRNIKYILTALLLLLLLGCAIRGIHIRSVQDVRQEARELAGITGKGDLESQRNGQDDEAGNGSGNPGTEESEGEIAKSDESVQNQTESGVETKSSEESQTAQTDASGEKTQTNSNGNEKSDTVENKRNVSSKQQTTENNKTSTGSQKSNGKTKKSSSKKQGSSKKAGKSGKQQTGMSGSDSGKRKISDGSSTKPDQYHTDPVPSGRPEPVNAEDQSVNQKKSFYVYLSIDVLTILDHMEDLKTGLQKYVPTDGWILPKTQVLCYEGETAWDVMSRECKARGINVETSYTPLYNSVYMEGINHIGEFDCGATAGWVYEVDGWIPNYSSSRYVMVEGEYLRWRYSCTGFGSDLEGAVRQ